MPYAPFNLSGTVALVTGGNRGIGYGMADAMAQAGADIAIWGTNEAKNAEAIAGISAHGVRAKAWRVDVANEGEVI
jgi:NAD(P)-dependent dehydrogenase (short-subunit alcohol dehydrogenase family)